MKLTYFELEQPIEFHDCHVAVLECAYPKMLRRLTERFVRQILEGAEELEQAIMIWEDEEPKPLKSALLLSDFYQFDLNQRSVIQALNRELESRLLVEQESIYHIEQAVFAFAQCVQEVATDLEAPIATRDDVGVVDLLKFLQVKIDPRAFSNPFDRILGIIDICADLKIAPLIVSINLSQCFDKAELHEIYKQVERRNIYLLDITPTRRVERSEQESILVIDEDGDEHRFP